MIDQYLTVFRKVGLVLRPDSDAEELVRMLREEFMADAVDPRKRYVAKNKPEEEGAEDDGSPELVIEEPSAPEIT